MPKVLLLENAYVLMIGISEYKNLRIPKLRFTRADEEEIFKLLTDPEKVFSTSTATAKDISIAANKIESAAPEEWAEAECRMEIA